LLLQRKKERKELFSPAQRTLDFTSFMIFLGALWPRSRLAASFSRFGLVRLGVAALGFQDT
jgi:hypothetical protein